MGQSTVAIILEGLAAIGGLAGIAALLRTVATLKNDKEAGAIKNEASVIESFKTAVDGFEDVITDLKNERNEAKAEAHTYRTERDAYRAACITAEGGFCINYGCPLRDPARGLGPQWLREHAGTDAIGGNYKTLAELMEDRGIKVEPTRVTVHGKDIQNKK